MRRHTFLLFVCLFVLAGRVHAQQESQLRAEFRHEGESFKKGCGNFSLKSIPGCAEVFFTGHPLHIAVGSIAPGNGFGAGPAFVTHYTPNEDWRLSFNADAIVSTNGSWRAGVYGKFIHTKIAPGTTDLKPSPILNVYAQATSLNKIAYYGLGPDTKRDDQTFFGMRETIVGANGIYPLWSKPLNLSLHGEVNGRFVNIRGNHEQSSPSIEQLHSEATAPGLNHQPAFVQFGEGVRLKPSVFTDNLRLNYFVNYQQFVTGDSQFIFQRLTVDLSHQIPLSKKVTELSRDHNGPDDCSTGPTSTTHDCPKITSDRVGSINLRFLLTESYTSSGHVVPFYFQPTLGGSDINGKSTLASFQDYRFRAPNLMLFQGSIEHSIYGPLGATFLAETGKVARTRSEIEFKHLRHSYAAGLTLRAGGFPMVYLMFAWGSREGTHTIASINTSLLGGSSRPSLY
jgi:hypothetical protein